jgi:hypothetical protein
MYGFDENSLKYLIEKLKTKFVTKAELNSKVDKIDGYRLISEAEADKLGALVLGNGGQVEISGKVNADNVEGLDAKLDLKVDKVTGMGLSSNDYTTAEKNKLSGIADGATKVVVDSALSGTSTNAVQNKAVTTEINSLKTLVNNNTSAISNITHPVTSVNGKTGAIVLTASDVGALSKDTELHTHTNKNVLDTISQNKISSWDNKSDFSGSYNDLTDTPNVLDDKSAEFLISDEDENVIFRVDINGTRTTVLETDTLILAGKDVSESYCTKPVVYSATIETTWTGDTAPYTQDIVVSGITASDKPKIDVIMSGTYSTDKTRDNEWSKIYRIVTAENKITVYAHAKTTASLPIQMEVTR